MSSLPAQQAELDAKLQASVVQTSLDVQILSAQWQQVEQSVGQLLKDYFERVPVRQQLVQASFTTAIQSLGALASYWERSSDDTAFISAAFQELTSQALAKFRQCSSSCTALSGCVDYLHEQGVDIAATGLARITAQGQILTAQITAEASGLDNLYQDIKTTKLELKKSMEAEKAALRKLADDVKHDHTAANWLDLGGDIVGDVLTGGGWGVLSGIDSDLEPSSILGLQGAIKNLNSALHTNHQAFKDARRRYKELGNTLQKTRQDQADLEDFSMDLSRVQAQIQAQQQMLGSLQQRIVELENSTNTLVNNAISLKNEAKMVQIGVRTSRIGIGSEILRMCLLSCINSSCARELSPVAEVMKAAASMSPELATKWQVLQARMAELK